MIGHHSHPPRSRSFADRRNRLIDVSRLRAADLVLCGSVKMSVTGAGYGCTGPPFRQREP